ncbi:MAG: hypothetical protein NC548_33890 [Lachnospiraceae bacterium]|nr:hypothetical protein [Lachnospiraceae bacterium]
MCMTKYVVLRTMLGNREFIGWGYTPEQQTPDFIDEETVVNLTSTEGAVINLYALWRKDLTLTFNLQGGIYDNSPDQIQLKASVYNSQKTYTFSIDDTLTPADPPKYSEQEGTIDAYGTVIANGLNTKYAKTDEQGNKYRLLGWNRESLPVPEENYIVYDTNHNLKHTISHDETFKAVWEPILVANLELKRVLGDKAFPDGTMPKPSIESVTAVTPNPTVEFVGTSGEQGSYTTVLQGVGKYDITVKFDDSITNIYKDGPTKPYADKLNPVTSENKSELLEAEQKHGLNRKFHTTRKAEARKFYIPQYLGTQNSYEGNAGISDYNVKFTIQQPSFYYQYVHGTKETINITGKIKLLLDPTTSYPTSPTPESPTPDLPVPDSPTTITEFRSRILN